MLIIPARQGGQVSPMWLTVTYLLHTFGELSLSPVGLSAMTKLAPARIAGLMMGVWFLGDFASAISSAAACRPVRVVAAAESLRRGRRLRRASRRLVMFALTPPIKRLMGSRPMTSRQ